MKDRKEGIRRRRQGLKTERERGRLKLERERKSHLNEFKQEGRDFRWERLLGGRGDVSRLKRLLFSAL